MKISFYIYSFFLGIFFSGCFTPESQQITIQWFTIDIPRLLSLGVPIVLVIAYYVKSDLPKWYWGLLIFIITHLCCLGMFLLGMNVADINIFNALKAFYSI